MPTVMLMVYMVLNSSCRWVYLTIEQEPFAGYCVALQAELDKRTVVVPGNMRVLCTEDRRVEL
jgi:hypothetical protein